MDQEKTGKFIFKLRKEKNMTQQELANILGVTDRAISKWENGRGMPELALLKPLCDILEITINELLSGEKIDKKDYPKKYEENLINTIDYTDNLMKKNNKIFKIIITIIITILSLTLCLIMMFLIDVRRMSQNKPVLFSTWGFKYTPPINLQEDEIYLSIRNYLTEKGDNEYKHHDGEKTFVSMRVYLLEETKKDSLYYVYAWVMDSKYYLENNKLKESSGSSIPYKFNVEKINDEYTVTDFRIPRDGSYYKEDMKNIFPISVRLDMEKCQIDGTIEKLKMEVLEQAKLYFHK